jgi:hypothetical protein
MSLLERKIHLSQSLMYLVRVVKILSSYRSSVLFATYRGSWEISKRASWSGLKSPKLIIDSFLEVGDTDSKPCIMTCSLLNTRISTGSSNKSCKRAQTMIKSNHNPCCTSSFFVLLYFSVISDGFARCRKLSRQHLDCTSRHSRCS